jgi:hypothetical protein
MGSVTLSMEEYKALEQKGEIADRRIAELEAEVVRARLEDKEDRVQQLVTLVRALMVPLRFAIANMPPEVTRHWPMASLKEISALLPTMPGATDDDHTLAIELNAFAHEAERNERERLIIKPTPTEIPNVDEKASSR